MSRKIHVFLLVSACALTSCGREPRSQSYFEIHDADRAEVLAGCKNGTHTGQECQLAQLAADTVAAKQRHANRREILRQTYEAPPAK